MTTEKRVYVTMTDSFMSGWGLARDKTNKLVFVCDNYEEAEIVMSNAENRSDMKYVKLAIHKPRYNEEHNFVQFKTKDDYPNWFVAGYFKKQKEVKA